MFDDITGIGVFTPPIPKLLTICISFVLHFFLTLYDLLRYPFIHINCLWRFPMYIVRYRWDYRFDGVHDCFRAQVATG